MPDIKTAVQGLQNGGDVLFLLMGAILVFAMHGGFAFLEVGTVRHKNQAVSPESFQRPICAIPQCLPMVASCPRPLYRNGIGNRP